ncbi:MAG: nucleoside triphosphate pyrophosphatase [Bdellovibrionales bacterium]
MISLNRTLILASGSQARQKMLKNISLEFEIIPADIDEDAILKLMQKNKEAAKKIAAKLACEKALSVSSDNPNAFIIGSDQVMECEGTLFQKAASIDEARDKLKTLRNRSHTLTSSVAVALNNQIIWQASDSAVLKMHDFDDEFLETYLNKAGNDVTSCVGAYAYESYGAWLFEQTKANYFTILGMPLLPLLQFLREQT